MKNLLFIHWNINPNIPLPFDGFTIQWYGLMWTISILLCFYVGRWILKREAISEEQLVNLIQYLFLGAVIGARLGQVIFYEPSFFIHHPLEIFKVWKGGLASHGGVIGGLIAIYLFQKSNPQFSLIWLLDRIALVIFLPCCLIRLGNLFNSEIIGIPTQMPWGFIFQRVDEIPRHPVVLYESIAYLLLFFLGVFLYTKNNFMQSGRLISYFFIGTFSVRFLLEFLKLPEGEMILNTISKTQLLNIPVIILGLYFFFFYIQKNKNGSL